jgi:hypothetical protein
MQVKTLFLIINVGYYYLYSMRLESHGWSRYYEWNEDFNREPVLFFLLKSRTYMYIDCRQPAHVWKGRNTRKTCSLHLSPARKVP